MPKVISIKGFSEEELIRAADKGDVKAKRELARRLTGKGETDKNKRKGVRLLEECVECGDAKAMVMLAKCCALGCGMEYDGKRAEGLISEAAKKGNEEGRCLMELIDSGRSRGFMDMRCLQCFTT